MPRRIRLDAELVRRGLARSRDDAARLVAEGRVSVRGIVTAKVATAVDPETRVVVTGEETDPGWASRGAYKLLGALEWFGPAGFVVAGRRCLDAGASTGGFTDVLLCEGAAEVVAVDVGYGQLDWRLRTDERVRVHERTNVRSLTRELIDGPVQVIVADLSFISLRLVLPALAGCASSDAELALMVKPQFEIGRDRLGSGGVVRDPVQRAETVLAVAETAAEQGLGLRDVVASPLPGPSGNVEYFLWLRPGSVRGDLATQVHDAVARGPR